MTAEPEVRDDQGKVLLHEKDEPDVISILDVTRARFHSPIGRLVYVRLPPEDGGADGYGDRPPALVRRRGWRQHRPCGGTEESWAFNHARPASWLVSAQACL